MQRNFLWQGLGTNRKWALVTWKTLCLTKNEGGLGLRDPKILSAILGSKTWWRWPKNQTELWARF